MKITQSWLIEYVDLNVNSSQLSDIFIKLGIEVENISNAQIDQNILIGHVTECKKDLKSNKLHICKVDIGSKEVSIVCGACNIKAGMKVAVATLGAKIGDIVISKRIICGHSSEGMILSEQEVFGNMHIGFPGSEGIMDLSSFDVKIGNSFAYETGLNCDIYDLSITPNRGDLLSAYGISREISSHGFGKLKDINYQIDAFNGFETINEDELLVECDDIDYSLIKIENISNQMPISLKMFVRLMINKINLNNPIVDILNYLTLDLGQPMHAFDALKIQDKIIISKLDNDTNMHAINDTNILIEKSTIIAKDKDDIICFSGIIGDKSRSISYNTNNIYLETAYFDKSYISMKVNKHGILNESSKRFARGIDYKNIKKIANIAANKIIEMLNGSISKSFYKSNFNANYKININAKNIEIINNNIHLLKNLGYDFSLFYNENIVIRPSWRNDIDHDGVILSDILRNEFVNNKISLLSDKNDFYSLNKQNDKNYNIENQSIRYHAKIRDILIYKKNSEEIISLLFHSIKIANLYGEDYIKVNNPMSAEQGAIRSNLISSLIRLLKKYQDQKHPYCNAFEIGHAYNIDGIERNYISSIKSGIKQQKSINSNDASYDIFDIKDEINDIAYYTNSNIKFEFNCTSENIPKYFYYKKAFKILNANNSKIIGYGGLIHPEIINGHQIKLRNLGEQVYGYQICMNGLIESSDNKHSKIDLLKSHMQHFKRDISCEYNKSFIYIYEVIESAMNDDFNNININVFDIYKNPNSDQKYISFSLLFDIQYSKEDIDNFMLKIYSLLKDIDCEVRS